MIENEESRLLFERIKKGEVLKAMSLLDSVTEKFEVKPYADSYTAVMIVEVIRKMNLCVSGFYADESEFMNMLFDGSSSRDCRKKVIEALCKKANSARKISYDDALKKAESYISECYCDFQLCDDVLCDITGVPVGVLTSLFKKKYAVGPGEFISRYRIEKSIELLEKTDFTIDKIAEMTGFYDAETYSRAFKKFNYVTPGKYCIAAKKTAEK